MGDRYLRKLLVLGATSRLKVVKTGGTPLDAWTRRLLEHKDKRLVTVALANKTARILWAVMTTGQQYRPERAAALARPMTDNRQIGRPSCRERECTYVYITGGA